jgi:hypothetical protein
VLKLQWLNFDLDEATGSKACEQSSAERQAIGGRGLLGQEGRGPPEFSPLGSLCPHGEVMRVSCLLGKQREIDRQTDMDGPIRFLRSC